MGVRRQRRSRFCVYRSRPLVGLMLGCAVFLVAHGASAQQRQKRVLTFYSTRLGAAATSAVDRAIEETLAEGLTGRLDYHAEFLDLARFPEPGYQLAVRDFLRSKYEHRRFDLIVATTSAALEFVSRYRDELFPGTPLVFSGGPGSSGGADATGVTSELNFSDTLQIASAIQPGVRRVFVVSGASEFDKYYETLARSQFKAFDGRLAFTYLSGLPLPELLRHVAQLPADAIIYFLTVFEDGHGDKFVDVDALNRMAAAANAPIYSWHSIAMDHGIVGGSLQSADVLGKRIADLGLRVLHGETADAIPVATFNPNVVEFDWRQLRRWRIDESRLPPGNVVRFRQAGPWELYRGYIVGGTVVVLVQTMLIAGLLVQLQRRRRVERDLRESEERFRLMADTAPVLIWRSGPDKLCDFFNRPWLEFTGRTIEQELGTGWVESVNPEDREQCLRTYTAAFDVRESFRMEYRLRRADGVYRWVLDAGIPRSAPDGRFAGYIGSCIDITERREAENALHESQNRYALATAAGAVGVWDWNLDTDDIYVDPQLQLLLGYRNDAIGGCLEDWERRLHPDDREAVKMQAQACIEGRVEGCELEHRMLHKNGNLRWFRTRGSVMRRVDGTPYRLVGTCSDITERKRAQEEIDGNEAALQASNEEIQNLAGRLIVAQEAERTRIARDLHDDVSQQLAGFSIGLSNLKRQLAARENDNGAVQDAVTSLQQRTIALAENVRYLSHDLHPGVLTHAGLVAALRAHCDEFRRQYAMEVTFNADDDLDSCDAEAQLCLYRVAQEVLRNTAAHAEARHANVQLVRMDAIAELTIADNGKGFDATRAGGRGHGLGLLSINERVRLAGGTVRIVAELNRGTSVRVRIPMNRQVDGRTTGDPARAYPPR